MFMFGGMLGALAAAVGGSRTPSTGFSNGCTATGQPGSRSQLSEALSLQANVLRAGQSLSRSLRILAEETKAPLSEELERMLSEVEFGRPMEASLERFAARIPSKDVDMWVTSMLVHRQTGGNLAGVMDSSAQRVSQRLQLRSEIKAMTAQGRLSGLVVAVAPLAFFFLLSIGSREQMEFLFTSALGLDILIVGLSMNVVGMLWIRHALRIRAVNELLLAALSGATIWLAFAALRRKDPVVAGRVAALTGAGARRPARRPVAALLGMVGRSYPGNAGAATREMLAAAGMSRVSVETVRGVQLVLSAVGFIGGLIFGPAAFVLRRLVC